MIALGLGQQRRHVADQVPVGRLHAAADRLVHLRQQALARARIHALGRDPVELVLEARVQRVLLRRLGDEAAHLRQHLLHRELRRDDAFGLALLQALDQLVELARELGETRNVIARLAGIGDLVHLRHEVGQLALLAGHLVDREVVLAPGVALDLDAQEIFQRVVGQLPFAVERRAIVAAQHQMGLAHLVGGLLLGRRRGIVEVGAVEVEPARQNAQRRQQFRLVDRKLGECAAVKPVDAQRLEVPDVGEQRAGQQHHSRQPRPSHLKARFMIEFPESKARRSVGPG